MKLSFLSFAAFYLVGQGHAAKPQPRIHLDAAVESDDKPELSVLDIVKNVQKGSEVKQLRGGATTEEERKKKGKKKKKGGKKKKSRSATSPTSPDIPDSSPDEDTEFSAVYAMTNQPDGNSILVYSRNTADGTLTFQGPPVPTGGNGAGLFFSPADPLSSQDGLIVAKRCLLAVNAGSGTVSSFYIESEDTINHVGTYPSGGSFPCSLTERAGFLYVLNAGGSGSFKGFTLADNCELAGNTNDVNLQQGDVAPTNPVAGFASPAEINFTRDGNLVVLIKSDGGGQNFEMGVSGVGSLNHYTVDRKGRVNQGSLTKTSLVEFPGAIPYAMDFDNEDRLLVTHGFTGDVSEWELNDNGSFTLVNQVNTGNLASCWVRFIPSNKCVYTSNGNPSHSISSLSAAPGFDHQLVESLAFSGILTPVDVSYSTDGKNLYVLSNGVGDPSGTGGIYAYTMASDCGLTQLPTVRDGFEPEFLETFGTAGLAVYPGSSWGLVD